MKPQPDIKYADLDHMVGRAEQIRRERQAHDVEIQAANRMSTQFVSGTQSGNALDWRGENGPATTTLRDSAAVARAETKTAAIWRIKL